MFKFTPTRLLALLCAVSALSAARAQTAASSAVTGATSAAPSTTMPAVTATAPSISGVRAGPWGSFSDMIDQLPAFLANTLPGLNPEGAVRFYTHPHVGDFFKKGYIRLPIGVRAKLSEQLSGNAEVQSYASKGADTGPKRGLSNLNVGAKYEHVLPQWLDGGLSLGFNYRTPLSRPPRKFTDGYRVFQPYVAVTRLIVPKWELLGYSSVGLNLLQSTAIPSNFGRNQLHGNAITWTNGVTRRWKRFQVSVTTRYATTALMTDEFHQNFWVRPELVFPLRLRETARTQLFVVLDDRVTFGPDGRQNTTSAGLRVQFHFDRDRKVSMN